MFWKEKFESFEGLQKNIAITKTFYFLSVFFFFWKKKISSMHFSSLQGGIVLNFFAIINFPLLMLSIFDFFFLSSFFILSIYLSLCISSLAQSIYLFKFLLYFFLCISYFLSFFLSFFLAFFVYLFLSTITVFLY